MLFAVVAGGVQGAIRSCHFVRCWRIHSSHPEGDPFSHPSGSSVSRPIRVTDRSAVDRVPSTHSARPPPASAGARKHSVPNRVQSVRDDLWLTLRAARPTCRRLTAWSNHHKFVLGPSPPRRGWGGGRPAASIQFCWLLRPDPFAGVQPVSPKSLFLADPKTRSAS